MQPNLTTYRHKCIYIFYEKKKTKKKKNWKAQTFTKWSGGSVKRKLKVCNRENEIWEEGLKEFRCSASDPLTLIVFYKALCMWGQNKRKSRAWQQNSFQFLWHAPLYIYTLFLMDLSFAISQPTRRWCCCLWFQLLVIKNK